MPEVLMHLLHEDGFRWCDHAMVEDLPDTISKPQHTHLVRNALRFPKGAKPCEDCQAALPPEAITPDLMMGWDGPEIDESEEVVVYHHSTNGKNSCDPETDWVPAPEDKQIHLCHKCIEVIEGQQEGVPAESKKVWHDHYIDCAPGEYAEFGEMVEMDVEFVNQIQSWLLTSISEMAATKPALTVNQILTTIRVMINTYAFNDNGECLNCGDKVE